MATYSSKHTDIFLTQQLTYHLPESLDNIRQRISDTVSDRRWFKSINVSAKFNDDGSFTCTPQWSFVMIRWIENSPAYLTGRLEEDGHHTLVHVRLRPNSSFVFFLFLLALLFVLALLGMGDFIEAPLIFKLLFYPSAAAILYGIMHWQTTTLRRNFEKVLSI